MTDCVASDCVIQKESRLKKEIRLGFFVTQWRLLRLTPQKSID